MNAFITGFANELTKLATVIAGEQTHVKTAVRLSGHTKGALVGSLVGALFGQSAIRFLTKEPVGVDHPRFASDREKIKHFDSGKDSFLHADGRHNIGDDRDESGRLLQYPNPLGGPGAKNLIDVKAKRIERDAYKIDGPRKRHLSQTPKDIPSDPPIMAAAR